MCKPGFDKKGNIKLGNMYTFSKLYGNQEHYIKAYDFCVKGTCGKYCSGCKNNCYVKASYRYGSVILKHAANTIASRTDLIGLFDILDKTIARAKNKPDTIRINQSGEIESREEFICWILLANKYPNINFYLYSKAFDLVIPEIKARHKAGTLPKNLTILISVWHEYGAKEFNEIKHIPNIKAFVYNDGFNYETVGIKANTKCYAYNGKKLNHDITCDKCRKCFSRHERDKVIFCDSH